MLEFTLGMIFMFVFGVISVVKPEWMWKLKYFLDVKNGEPTEFFITFTRISGVFCILFSTLLPLFMLLYYLFE